MQRVLSPLIFLWTAALLLSLALAYAQTPRAVEGNQHPVMKGELEGVLLLVTVKGR